MHIRPILPLKPLTIMIGELSNEGENRITQITVRNLSLKRFYEFACCCSMFQFIYVIVAIWIFITIEMEFEFDIVASYPFFLILR